MDNSGGMTFAEVLAQPGVVEEVELRGTFGFLAFHGGPVERVTTPSREVPPSKQTRRSIRSISPLNGRYTSRRRV